MPNRDKTGPAGQGTMTGRGLGPCAYGKGYGRGYGRTGFGSRFCPCPLVERTLTKDEEKKILETELKEMEFEKQEIEKRLKELKDKK
ncbi:MAG: DUF5320 domain-containing protein [Nanoarchaeota archaeon]|nr:DUF5320 domain-containing protein [Nanoarchaeota archaeon]